MTEPVTEFIEEARKVSIAAAAARLNLTFARKGDEHPQPCPLCGGKDRFAFNTGKNKWHCRGAGVGGGDAIGMAAHVLGLDVRRHAEFLAACEAVTGLAIPAGGERESDEEREARRRRIDRLQQERKREEEARTAAQADFRERERARARGIYEAATPIAGHDSAAVYLRNRGCLAPRDRWLRFGAEQTFWHGKDERAHAVALHTGPAMIAPFVRFEADGSDFEIIGCHITWIDLANAPKYRPVLIDPDTGEALPTKKMRGTKKGGVIPLMGDPSARRWVGAEGIENALAFARWEGARADTFHFAAGDLGNMAGPADPAYRRAHPTLKKADRNGKPRAVMVAGPVPLITGSGEPDAMVIPDHVSELVLLGDGDSEPVATTAAMVRAKARHARPGRLIPIVMPRPGTDLAAMLANHPAAFET